MVRGPILMKTSTVISLSPTDFSALTYEKDFEKGIKKIAKLGFDGIELAVANPKEIDEKKIVGLINSLSLKVPAIGTGQAYLRDGLSFIDPRKEIREKAVARIKSHIEFASEFDAQVIIGLIRGRINEGVNKENAETWCLECITRCADYAAEYDVSLTIEPINRYETNFINTVQEGISFIKQVNRKNFCLLLDTFHMNIEEKSIYESIRKSKNYLTHFHFADSNRLAPGQGHLDFKKIIETLKEIKYNGFVSAEILPFPNPGESVKLTIEFFKKML